MAQTQVTLALDSGALIAAEKDQRVEAIIRKWLREGATLLIPAVALAEVIRAGPRDAIANRLVAAVGFTPAATEEVARNAGARLGKGRGDAVDAMIVATAEMHGANSILTTDPSDLGRLASKYVNVIGLT